MTAISSPWSRFLIVYLTALLLFSPSGVSRAQNIPVTYSNYPRLSHHAEREIEAAPQLSDFISRFINGDSNSLTGVYVANTFVFPIVQQPEGQDVFVSDTPETITQFRSASRFGTVGLLAHNSLAGADFFRLRLGQRVTLVRGDGSLREYKIQMIRRFQALDPESPFSQFIDLDKPQGELSSADVFNQMYNRGDQVVFQTCIAKDGNASWGRIFIIATPTVSAPEVASHPSAWIWNLRQPGVAGMAA